MWITAVGLPKPIGAHVMIPHAWKLNMELQDLVFALLSFSLAFVPFLLSMPRFFSFEMRMFPLFHSILKVCII
jgi:hypothetical protein